jgi:iron-sulfur cluster assembly protein
VVQEQTALSITPLAAERAREILNRYNKPEAAIRVFIKSGGCSGYQYGMAVDERELEGDTAVEMLGVRLVVDRMSLPLLAGSEVDWVENLMGGGFSVNNPQATSSCGCGHSFRTDSSSAPGGEGSGGCSRS